MSRQRNVLVLCAHNSARSQMAEAFLRRHAGDGFRIESAGLEPAEIHPLALDVMKERGLPLEGHHPKPIRQFLGKWTVHDLIIVCERTEKECPKTFPGALRRHYWPFPDPAAASGSTEERLQVFRRVRDEIETRVVEWLREQGESR